MGPAAPAAVGCRQQQRTRHRNRPRRRRRGAGSSGGRCRKQHGPGELPRATWATGLTPAVRHSCCPPAPELPAAPAATAAAFGPRLRLQHACGLPPAAGASVGLCTAGVGAGGSPP